MRKKTKNEIMGIIDTLAEAHDAIMHMWNKGNRQEAYKLLLQCQECAIQIGTIIEEQEGQGTKAVALLEAYCEQLFEMNRITDPDKVGEQKQQLDTILLQAKHEVEESRNLPLKIVFMPYKASMWDCMESVWEAARTDEECEVYVVPLPYYEKDKEGGVSRLCCERDLFPQYVSVTSYEEFSLAKELPDVIYIHNPYDAANIVTTIHPAYYSHELKKYTDMLIYIPYFIVQSGMPESHDILPAYYHVDKIILQNEQMVKGIHESVPREKLTVQGNPKTDKILKLCANHPEIPERWKKMIYQADGTRKKVIMYNCSISAMLNDSKKFFDKMEYIFRIAKKTTGIVLLWRPHPLLEATLASMRPEWQERFKRIKKEFIKDRIGIYDETSDPVESIALCDAYIGESSSSMVTMFGVAGKPIFILNVNITKEEELITEEEMRALSFVDMAIDGEEGWFVTNRYQAICRMDMNTGDSHLVARIPELERGWCNRYNFIYKKEDKLYLTPLHTDALCIYDIKNNTFQKVYFPNTRVENFSNILFYQNEIILIPAGYDGILRYNEQSGTYRCVDGFIGEYEGLCSHYDESIPRFFGRNLYEEDILWLPCLQCNCVLRYDLRDDSWQYYEIGDKNNTYIDIIAVGDELWLMPFNNQAMVKWNRETGDCEEYKQYLDKIKLSEMENTVPFRGYYQNNKALYAIPVHADNIIKVDTKTCEMDVWDIGLDTHISERKFDHWKASANYEFYKEYKNYLILKLTYDESLLFISKNDMQLGCKIPVRLSQQELKKLQSMEMKADMKCRNGFFGLIENVEFDSLPIFMEQLTKGNLNKYHEQKRFYAQQMKNMNGSVGKKIHEYIKAEILI